MKVKFEAILFFSLLLIGIFIGGFISGDTYICTVPRENTVPEFDVIFGQKKLEWNCPDSLKEYQFNFDCLWTDSRPSNKEEYFLGDFEGVYFIKGTFDGKDQECSSEIWNPKLKVHSYFRINEFWIACYLIVLGYCGLILLIHTSKQIILRMKTSTKRKIVH